MQRLCTTPVYNNPVTQPFLMCRVFSEQLHDAPQANGITSFYSLLHAINRLAGYRIFANLSHFLAVRYASTTTQPLLQLALMIQ